MKTFLDFGIKNIGNGRAVCPECTPYRKPQNQNKKDLSINEKEGVWYCHHCNWSGTLKIKHKTFPVIQDTTDKFFKFWEKRGISKLILAKMKVSIQGQEIKYPFFYDGNCVNIKYERREKDKKYFRQEKDALKVFYNIDSIEKEKEVYIVEGEKDVLSLMQIGIDNVISIPDGALNPSNKTADEYRNKLNYIDNCYQKLKHIEKFYLFLDADKNGEFTKEILAQRLDKNKCFYVNNDTDCKDANDILVKYGRDKLKEISQNLIAYPVREIITISQIKSQILNYIQNPIYDTVNTNCVETDNLLRNLKGNLVILNAIPNHGKSTWLTDYLIRLNIFTGYRSLIYSGEHQFHKVYTQLIQQLIGKPVLFDRNNHANILEITKAVKYLESEIQLLQTQNHYIKDFVNIFKVAKLKYGSDIFVIDNISKTKDVNDVNNLKDGLNYLSDFAKNSNSGVILVTHPTKMPKIEGYPRTTQNEYRPPRIYDTYGTSFYNNLIDIGINFYLDKGNYTRDQKHQWHNKLHVEKVREQPENGLTGLVKLKFEESNKRFYAKNFDVYKNYLK